jgi:predicted negative regulator of RcsB-dependent stress response
LSLKDDLKSVKQELNSEEKFLESSIKLERFYKKYKFFIFGGLIALLIGIGWYQYSAYAKEANLQAANEAFLTLLKDPESTSAKDTLKDKNPDLYALYSFSNAIKDNKIDQLDAVIEEQRAFISSVAGYEKASKQESLEPLVEYANSSNTLKELAALQATYLYIQDGEYEKAKNMIDQIPANSKMATIVNMYKHFLITKGQQ